MKQGLSLRVSQHLALTPQLQQSIRLLQLSTLELSQEVEQMLDENPFLEIADDTAPREEFGLEHTNTPVSQDSREFESATDSIAASADETGATSTKDTEVTAELSSESKLEDSWEGDGSVDSSPDDSEWGGDAPAQSYFHRRRTEMKNWMWLLVVAGIAAAPVYSIAKEKAAAGAAKAV